MKPRVLFSAPHDFLDLAAFEGAFELHKHEAWHLSDITIFDVDAWIPNPGQHFVVDTSLLDRFKDLRVIATPSTGTNHLDLEACKARGVKVLSLLDDRDGMESISASAEFTFLHVLNALRRFDVGMTQADSSAWRSNETILRGRELESKTVGLVGLGRIGRRLIRYLDAFGSSIHAYDPHAPGVEAPVTREADLPALFRTCELVVVCCSLTDETRGLIDGELLDLLPAGGIVVNTARGEILDEASICKVMQARTDLTLSTDVLSGEVANEHATSCLWALRKTGRVIITPHMAGVTHESQQKAAEISLKLTLRFLRGDDPGAGIETDVERREELDHVAPHLEI